MLKHHKSAQGLGSVVSKGPAVLINWGEEGDTDQILQGPVSQARNAFDFKCNGQSLKVLRNGMAWSDLH